MEHHAHRSVSSPVPPPLAAPICPAQAERWLAQVFSARSAQGGVVRRSVAWIDREVGRERFIHEVRRRGFHLLRSGNQFIVVCHSGSVEVLF